MHLLRWDSKYHILGSAILKSYELVLEAYRQKCRNHRKSDAQTYVEFLRQEETYFDRWNTARNVENKYEKLRQLILIKEFKKLYSG